MTGTNKAHTDAMMKRKKNKYNNKKTGSQIMAETLSDYLPGESKKMEHAIRRTGVGCIFCKFANFMVFLQKNWTCYSIA